VKRTLLARTWLVTVFTAIGLAVGVLVAYIATGRAERFTAQATLAMLPAQDVPISQASNFWDVLNRGQATRSAAVVLEDESWLDVAASAAGVPKSDLSLSAGAIPDTTLITVTMKANSASSAEAALQAVLTNAVGPAATVSGPFRLQVVASAGSAHSMSPNPVQMFGAFGIAGLLVGAGVGLLATRSSRSRSRASAQGPSASVANGVRKRKHARIETSEQTDNEVGRGDAETLSLEISPR
jgi:hypothetical protein